MSFVKVLVLEKVKIFQKLTLIKQSLFSLPWLIATSLFVTCAATNQLTCSYSTFVFLILSFFSARLGGMSLNRLIDFEIDARNPRTKKRPLQVGEIQHSQVAFISFVCLSLFLVFSYLIDNKVFFFSLFPLAMISLYSFTKRFTFLCHFVLGLVHFSLPIGVGLAMTSSYSWLTFFLGLALGLSIASNDIIYAFQDIDYDQEEGLYSMPACFGRERALLCARYLHFFSCISLLLVSFYLPHAAIYLTGVFAIFVYLCLMHLRLMVFLRKDRFHSVFTNSNITIGSILLFAALGEFVWHVL